MPSYTVKHPSTGKSVTITGDTPPTEADLDQIFAATGSNTADAAPAVVDRQTQLGKGAKMTPQEASTHYANLAQFAKDGGVKMFGTPAKDTRKISYTGSGYKPNQPATSAKEFAKNFAQDVVEAPLFPVKMAADIANAPDTWEAVKETGKSLVTTPLGFVPGIAELATGRTAKENWLTNPGLGAMVVAGGGELAAKGVPKVADFALTKGAGAADAAAAKLYDMTLKQGTTLKPEIRRQNVKEGLDGGYLPNGKGVDKLAADVSALEKQVGEGLAAGKGANVRGTLDRARANIEALREQANRSADPARNNALIDSELEKLSGNPMLDESGTIPIQEMQRMKVEQGRAVKYQEKTNQAVDPFQTSINKARIRGLKEELETQLADVFPELADTNRQLSRKYQLQGVLERAASRIENNQGIGIGLPIKGGAGATIGGMVGGPGGAAIGGGIGALIGIIEHPAVAPRLALALRRAARGKMSKAEAMTLANERLDKMKNDLTKPEPPDETPPTGGDVPPPTEGPNPPPEPPQGSAPPHDTSLSAQPGFEDALRQVEEMVAAPPVETAPIVEEAPPYVSRAAATVQPIADLIAERRALKGDNAPVSRAAAQPQPIGEMVAERRELHEQPYQSRAAAPVQSIGELVAERRGLKPQQQVVETAPEVAAPEPAPSRAASPAMSLSELVAERRGLHKGDKSDPLGIRKGGKK